MIVKKLALTYKHILLYIFTFVIVVGGDQLTKTIIDHTLQLNGGYTIIDNFFYLTYAHNSGGAWGILSGHMILFFVVSLIATIGIIYFFQHTESYQKLTRYGLVLVFCGMVGNLIDRILFGYVRDFIDFLIIGYDFPIFNVADIAITVGVFLIILETGLEEYKAWKLSKSNL